MSKKGIIRVIYGDVSGDGHGESRLRANLDKDIDRALSNEDIGDFTTYVFGINNLKVLEEKGLNCVLVDERPRVLERRHYCNKIIALDRAMEDFDEILYLDWDTIPTKPLPDNFWDVLRSKDVIQCPLYKCTRGVNAWRTGRIPPKLLSGTYFVYIRDRSVLELPLAWATHQIELPKPFGPKWADETYFSRYIDSLMDSWDSPHVDVYKKEYLPRFEPLLCWHRFSIFKDMMENMCFKHV